MISTLVDWNYPPAFPAGIPTSAPGHLATPSEESNADVEEPTARALDIEIPESVYKETLSPSIHEEVITQVEQDLDEALVENTETVIDATSIPELAPVEDSELQLTSQTLIVEPSFPHTSSNDLVNDTQITEHEEGVLAEEAARGRKTEVEITLEDVTQLVDEDSTNESAPAQQGSKDTVDDEIGLRDVDTSMQETKAHMGKSFTSSWVISYIYFTQA